MKKRVYILGAGASCALGLPAMNSLTWELCRFLPQDQRVILEDVVFEIFGLREKRGDPSPNFEELLNYLDPRSFTYLEGCGIDLSAESRSKVIEIVLLGLRGYIREKCDGARIDAQATAHHVSNIIASRNEASQRQVLVPFHFLPGNQESPGWRKPCQVLWETVLSQPTRTARI